MVDSALLDFRTDLTRNPDSYAQQENDEVEDMLVPQDEDPDEDYSLHEETGQLPGNSAVLMIDTEVNSRIRSLNIKQGEIYEVCSLCGTNSLETSEHFLLHCPTYAYLRLKLFDNLRNNNILLLPLDKSITIQILLYGSDNYDPLVNKIILSIVINFIIESKRFDDPLIQC